MTDSSLLKQSSLASKSLASKSLKNMYGKIKEHLQSELQAIEEEKKGGKYIRPIVLFQAQPKNGKDFLNEEEEKSNVQKLKEKLIELKIPAEQIKIKTANINKPIPPPTILNIFKKGTRPKNIMAKQIINNKAAPLCS